MGINSRRSTRQHAKLSLAAYHRAPVGTPESRVPVVRDSKIQILTRSGAPDSSSSPSESRADLTSAESSLLQPEVPDMAQYNPLYDDDFHRYGSSDTTKAAVDRAQYRVENESPMSSVPVALEDLIQYKPINRGRRRLKQAAALGQDEGETVASQLPQSVKSLSISAMDYEGSSTSTLKLSADQVSPSTSMPKESLEHNLPNTRFADAYGPFPNFPQVPVSTLFDYPSDVTTANGFFRVCFHVNEDLSVFQWSVAHFAWTYVGRVSYERVSSFGSFLRAIYGVNETPQIKGHKLARARILLLVRQHCMLPSQLPAIERATTPLSMNILTYQRHHPKSDDSATEVAWTLSVKTQPVLQDQTLESTSHSRSSVASDNSPLRAQIEPSTPVRVSSQQQHHTPPNLFSPTKEPSWMTTLTADAPTAALSRTSGLMRARHSPSAVRGESGAQLFARALQQKHLQTLQMLQQQQREVKRQYADYPPLLPILDGQKVYTQPRIPDLWSTAPQPSFINRATLGMQSSAEASSEDPSPARLPTVEQYRKIYAREIEARKMMKARFDAEREAARSTFSAVPTHSPTTLGQQPVSSPRHADCSCTSMMADVAEYGAQTTPSSVVPSHEHTVTALPQAQEQPPLTSEEPSSHQLLNQAVGSDTPVLPAKPTGADKRVAYEAELNSFWNSGMTSVSRQKEFISRHLAAEASSLTAPRETAEAAMRVLVPMCERLQSYATEANNRRSFNAASQIGDDCSATPAVGRVGDYFASFVDPPEWCVDKSLVRPKHASVTDVVAPPGFGAPNAKSLFGEQDWVGVPDRVGRDPRYRPMAATAPVGMGRVGSAFALGSIGSGVLAGGRL